MDLANKSNFPLVVIIGGGFGGLQVAENLKDKPVNVLMLDKNNYHGFWPLLYQVAMGSLECESIAFSLRKKFDGQKNFRFRVAEVSGINTESKHVETNIGDIAYDYLVVATGSTTNFFGNKEIERFAMPMKTIPEALNIRYLILQNLEAAVLQASKEDREPYLNFVLVGAGPTGVELAGSLAEIKNHILTKDYPELRKEEMKVYLVDFLPKVLGPMSDDSSKSAEKFLRGMGVELLLGTKVESYDGEVIVFEGGKSIRTKSVIWSAGVMGQVPEGLGKDAVIRGNRIKTNAICQVDGHTDVFAIGDVAASITEGTPNGHPGVAQVAMQQGKSVAKNILNILEGKPTVPFSYFDKGSMATIGRNKAVVDISKTIKFQGFFAWLTWMFIHLISLMGGRNRWVVFINWVASYVSYNGGNRIIIRKFVKETSDAQKNAVTKYDQ
ncbi:NAD(P)/FAD-dependent oxidoreductase [Mucilaginibacter gynuensis]|uniref:NADH:ubiquinone reductase (non-electrogenic) n=1 Tax=Mucilaginibacter gynuensis TaxID=1302236 RepID=A0ABP8HKV7_9SPHI